jgi:hypothetical protein
MENVDQNLEEIYKAIPELRTTKTIALPRRFFFKLTDLQFKILYELPGLKISVSEKTIEYIEKRRLALGLTKQFYRKAK